MDGWMARHGDGCRQGCDEDNCNLDGYLCLKWYCRRQWQPHSRFPGLSTTTWKRVTRSDLYALDTATRIVLISITHQSHRADCIAKLVKRSLGQCHSHFSSQAPIGTWTLVRIFILNMRKYHANHSGKLHEHENHLLLHRVTFYQATSVRNLVKMFRAVAQVEYNESIFSLCEYFMRSLMIF